MSDDDGYHLRQIERHTAALRGDDPTPAVTPHDYRIPSGQALLRMREACGLSRRDVGARVDISHSHLSRVERDEDRPSARLVVALLRLYRREWPAEEGGDE